MRLFARQRLGTKRVFFVLCTGTYVKRVGFVVVKPQVECLLLDHLYIHPSTQSRGIGAAVLAVVIEQANAKALPIRVGALRESDSNRFYTRHGFVLVEQGEFDNFYIRAGKNALKSLDRSDAHRQATLSLFA
ncbi:GNAT family N-acetyltransferase [Limnohabitans sp. Rim8]|uniref:GNAT family N-acetyltransferase n=1 Tax=Limnohabitans sp. Rim8 TaxID=1100718 RepID=UPI0025CDFF36|nr:GNAT family N-acetyltransferase [Limnohabitans sp. Rim8]